MVVVVPKEQLNQDLLRRVVEEYITREGTDYGTVAVSFEEKVEQVLAQVRRGDALITFDPDTQRTHLVQASEWRDGQNKDD